MPVTLPSCPCPLAALASPLLFAWASWADCLAVLSRRLPRVAQKFLDHLDSPDPQPACFAAAAAARAALGHSDWAPPAWRELSAGESAPVVQEEGPSTFS